jgi:hypothetical protein
VTARSSSATLLDVLNVECDKCCRRGRYHLLRLIERYGIDAKLFDWSDEITADCPRRQSKNLYDQCGARCPDLSKGGLIAPVALQREGAAAWTG